VHPVVELGLDRVVQVLRRVREQVALLVDRAALQRDVVPQAGERRLEALAAIDDDEIGSGEPGVALRFSFSNANNDAMPEFEGPVIVTGACPS
jgi:hypothetical protein